jgi:hypothetical protein
MHKTGNQPNNTINQHLPSVLIGLWVTPTSTHRAFISLVSHLTPQPNPSLHGVTHIAVSTTDYLLRKLIF